VNILITGGAGFIGSNLVNLLSKNKKYKIIIIDNFSKGSINYIKKYNVKVKKGDIKNYKFLKKCFKKIDCVIHLAGSTRVIDSIKDPISNFKENLIGTLNLLSLSKERKVKNFIFASSGGALMGEKKKISSEKALPSPTSPYGASKLACEAYCMAFSKSYKLNVKCLRFSNIYGPYSWHKESIVAAFFKNILNNKTTTIYGDGTQSRDFIYVGDICFAIMKMINSKFNGVINIGSGKTYNIKKLIKEIKKITKLKIKIKYTKFRKGEIKNAKMNNSKAISLIKFYNHYTFREGLKNTWHWFNSYKSS
tara:strand:+ start:16056 stop:16976 length:921 start_codon:yes stop_codon:yes gene_type:complete